MLQGGQQMPAGGVCRDKLYEVAHKAHKTPSKLLTLGWQNLLERYEYIDMLDLRHLLGHDCITVGRILLLFP